MTYHTTSRRQFLIAVGLSAFALAGAGNVAASGHNRNFRAQLSGDNQVPPVETNAQGWATFQLNKAGDELSYKLLVANIENVTQAHIHTAPAGQNGPVVAWLYPEEGPPAELTAGRFDGILAESTITADDLVGPLDGGLIEDLVMLLRDGEAYVNVHTTAHPGGEVRGQIH